jgi:hypothetical protein
MINLDELDLESLEELVARATEDKQALGLQIWPHKPAGFMRALNIYIKYSVEKIEAMRDRSLNRESRAKKHEDNLNKIYGTIPEDFRW